MIFLSSQLQHDLIPQAHAPEDDRALVGEINDFRASMFQLFQQKIAEATAAYTEAESPNQLYLKIRRDLDSCPEIQAAHRDRGHWLTCQSIYGVSCSGRYRCSICIGQLRKIR